MKARRGEQVHDVLAARGIARGVVSAGAEHVITAERQLGPRDDAAVRSLRDDPVADAVARAAGVILAERGVGEAESQASLAHRAFRTHTDAELVARLKIERLVRDV